MANAIEGRCDRYGECELIAEVFHAISQPLTALEVGLEIALRQDKDVPELRSRVESALAIAQTLHQRLVDLRMVADVADSNYCHDEIHHSCHLTGTHESSG